MVQLTRADTIPAFVEEVIGRIHALARIHSLIAASRWEGASLSRLIEEELTPFTADGERIHIAGPVVELKPAAAQSMALIIHELTINAVKYGALSRAEGKVEIAWRLNDPGAPELTLCWTESGGPPVDPPTRTGFGTSLIHGSIERHLGGTVDMDWRREGLRCEIGLPARQLV
jgi:two-component sensor histidine kinase